MFARVLPWLALSVAILPAVFAAPVPRASAPAAGSIFPVTQYADIQISGGTAGQAEAEANAVFVTPFANVDLATVSSTDLKNLQNLRELAENAETQLFNPQIKAASGAAATALQNGKIKNKVLKLTGEIQGLKIQLAQGSKTAAASIAAEQKKLTNNIALDVKAAGQPSTAATGTPTA